MRILCVIDSLGSGGAQRQLVNLAIAFKKKGHMVSFLVYHSDSFYYEELSKYNISIKEIIEPNYFKRLLKIRRFVRSGSYDSILSFLDAANFITTISGFPFRKWRLVVGERSANPSILKSIKLRFFRFFHFFADAVVANSYENVKLIKRANPFLSNKKIHVIYNLIDFDKWKPMPDRYVFRKNGKFNLIVVASHQYLKNLNGLIEAVNLLGNNEKENLVIDWYGGDRNDDSRKKALEKIKKYKLNSVFRFHDPTLDISYKVNQADALGLFSFYEGLPNVVCEAMVNSKLVISSNVSDINLLIDNDYIFNPRCEFEISFVLRKILKLSEKECFYIGCENRVKALSLFEGNRIVEGYLKLLC